MKSLLTNFGFQMLQLLGISCLEIYELNWSLQHHNQDNNLISHTTRPTYLQDYGNLAPQKKQMVWNHMIVVANWSRQNKKAKIGSVKWLA